MERKIIERSPRGASAQCPEYKTLSPKRIQPPDLRTGGRLKSDFYAKLNGSGVEGRPEVARGHVGKLAEAGGPGLGQRVHREGAGAIQVAEQVGTAGIIEHRTLLEVVLDVDPLDSGATRLVVFD